MCPCKKGEGFQKFYHPSPVKKFLEEEKENSGVVFLGCTIRLLADTDESLQNLCQEPI